MPLVQTSLTLSGAVCGVSNLQCLFILTLLFGEQRLVCVGAILGLLALVFGFSKRILKFAVLVLGLIKLLLKLDNLLDTPGDPLVEAAYTHHKSNYSYVS